jgi:heme-degrading monooxygenase HmoA
MVIESARIRVVPGREAEFVGVIESVSALFQGAAGFEGASIHRCIEEPSLFELRVRWSRIEDHMEGFRGSEAFAAWRDAVGPYFAEAPEVIHFQASELEI